MKGHTRQLGATLDRIETCEGKDVITGLPHTPLVTIYGYDRASQPLVLSVRRADFEGVVRSQNQQGLPFDLACQAAAVAILEAFAGS